MMSCNLISAFTGTTTPEAKQVTTTPEISTLIVQTSGNSENQVIFTENDVTSWINDFSAQNADFKFNNPQVVINNGLCIISGDLIPVNSGNSNSIYNSLSGKIELQMAINLDKNNNPLIDIKSLKLNNDNLPGFVVDQFSGIINSSISSSISSELNGRSINQITLSDGKITIITN
jgi:hypothetical protein